MLKTAFGKAIVGAVALSGVATHAAYGVRGGTLGLQVGGRGLYQNEGLAKLPFKGTGLSDLTGNVQTGLVVDPAYTGGFNVSVEAIGQALGPVEATVAAKAEDSEGTEKSWSFKTIVPTETLVGGIVKGDVYSLTESVSLFVQGGAGVVLPKNDACANRFYAGLVGFGAHINIDGGLDGIVEYKHVLPFGENKTASQFGILSGGIKYNWS